MARVSKQGVDSGQVCIADARNTHITSDYEGVDVFGTVATLGVGQHKELGHGTATVINVDDGRDWRVYAEYTGGNGRPSAIVAVPVGTPAPNNWETIGTIVKPAGLVVSDPCYILTDDDYRGVLLVLNGCMSDDPARGIDDTTWVEAFSMANSSTLYGDGEYDVTLELDAQHRPQLIRVDFDDARCPDCGQYEYSCECDYDGWDGDGLDDTEE